MKAYQHLIRRALAQGFTISVDSGGDMIDDLILAAFWLCLILTVANFGA